MADAIDSNVLVYAVAGIGPKRARARAVLAEGGTVSAQALNETAQELRRKAGLSLAEVRDALATVRALVDVVPLTETGHYRALHLAEATDYSV